MAGSEELRKGYENHSAQWKLFDKMYINAVKWITS